VWHMGEEVLYHAEICLPKGFVAPVHVIRPIYSGHARRAAMTDRYGIIELPETLPLRCGRVIEVGIIGRRVSKILFRLPYDDVLDMCVVLIPGSWVAKTCWFNERNDAHSTLDRARYAVA
jgi:hypothetical protein